MKILYVGLDAMPHVGGIETFILKAATYINREKYEIELLSFKGDTPCFYDELTGLGCKFHFITKRRENFFLNTQEIKALFAEQRYDIVHCHLNSYSYITPCLQALKYGSKVIIHGHNSGCLQSKKSILLHSINKKRVPFSRITKIAVSDVAGKWFYGDRQFTVLKNGIETERFQFSEEKRRRIRQEFGLADNTVVLNVGAFRKQKNHQRIIEIFRDYLKDNPGAILLLVGEGDLRQEVVHRVHELGIEKRVIFTGNRSDVDAIMSASDMFLFPSFYEGFPIAMIEAECSGLPCMISDVITEQSRFDGLCTAVSLEEDNSSWVKAMTQIKENKNREKWAEIVRSKGLGIDSEIRQMETIYDHLMGDKS